MQDPHIILRVVSKFLIPFIALFAFMYNFMEILGRAVGFRLALSLLPL